MNPSESESAMVKKGSKRAKASTVTKSRREPEDLDEEERILREATGYLITKHGMFLVATGLREVRIKGFRVWIITVTLRYGFGDEGYIGDLLYDGEAFTFLTEQSVMDDRARKIAENPERIRQWNEYRASTLHPGKA
jgi:hypothetical protein